MAAQYEFQHPDGRIISIYQGMNDEHVYTDEEGVEWSRVFTRPNAVIDSIFSMNPNDSKGFVDKTGKMRNGKIGDLFQLSAEMSEKRTSKEGIDRQKIKSWENYESKRPKTTHPDRKKQQLKETFAKNKVFDIDI